MHHTLPHCSQQHWTQSFHLIDARGLASIKAFFAIHEYHHIYVPLVDEREYAIKVMSSIMFFFSFFKVGSVNFKLI